MAYEIAKLLNLIIQQKVSTCTGQITPSRRQSNGWFAMASKEGIKSSGGEQIYRLRKLVHWEFVLAEQIHLEKYSLGIKFPFALTPELVHLQCHVCGICNGRVQTAPKVGVCTKDLCETTVTHGCRCTCSHLATFVHL